MTKNEKSSFSVSEIDRRADGQMTDNSALEKLCCLSAGGAKKFNMS